MDEIEAGRALDREVGIKIFGYSLYHYDKDYAEHCYWQLLSGLDPVAMEHGRGWGERKTPEEAWEDCPHFSTDIGAAWQVVERIGGYFLLQHAIRTGPFGFPALTWYCAFAAPRRFEAAADTGPLAICRAALMWADEQRPADGEGEQR